MLIVFVRDTPGTRSVIAVDMSGRRAIMVTTVHPSPRSLDFDAAMRTTENSAWKAVSIEGSDVDAFKAAHMGN